MANIYKESYNDDLGRHLVATEDIPAGTIINKEAPLVLGPCWSAEYEPICIGCYAKMTRPAPCPQCTWPLCSFRCPGRTTEHAPECHVFRRADVCVTEDDGVEILHPLIIMVRCIYFNLQDPEKWQRVCTLDSGSRSSKNNNISRSYCKILNFYFGSLEIPDNIIMFLYGVLKTNAIEIRMKDCSIQGLYYNGSLLQHSCIPNTQKSYDEKVNLIVRATVPIKTGNNLATIYTDALWPTQARREYLEESKNFACTCARCMDPLELGTNIHSLKCMKCGKGWCAPTIAPDPFSEDWECQSCHKKAPGSSAEEMEVFLKSSLEEVEEGGNLEVGKYESFLKKYEKMMHPHHFVLLEIKYSLIQMYDKNSNVKPSKELLKKKERYCRDILEVANVIVPGYSRLRGTTLFELQDVLFKRVQYDPSVKQEAIEALKECTKILATEPECQPEGRLGKVCLKKVEDLGLGTG